MQNQTFLFYDLETTGLHTVFDQAIQYASIRTTPKWEELDTENCLIALNPDIIPSPYAMITHHIDPHTLADAPSEWESMLNIHAQLNTPNTISLGYNTLSFDDDMLRFSFYRHLLPPYTHQYANHCYRADLFPMVIMYHLFQNETIQWPEKDNRVSLKLADLNTQNQWVTGPAHDALVDVQVCVALTKALSHNERMWSYCLGFFQKKIDQQRLQKLPAMCPLKGQNLAGALAIAPYLGHDLAFQAPVLYLGTHLHYSNQTLWLRLDTEELNQTNADSMTETTRVLRKKNGETPFMLPLTDRFTKHLTPERQSLMQQNLQWLQKNPDTLQAIIDYHCDYTYPDVPQADIEAQLYQLGFPSREEERLYHRFHQSSIDQKAGVVEQFRDTTRQLLAERLLTRYHPSATSEEANQSFQQHIKNIYDAKTPEPPVDHQGRPKRTLVDVYQEIAEIEANRTLNQQEEASLARFKQWLAAQTHVSCIG